VTVTDGEDAKCSDEALHDGRVLGECHNGREREAPDIGSPKGRQRCGTARWRSGGRPAKLWVWQASPSTRVFLDLPTKKEGGSGRYAVP
jgi:hypothetical protein